MFLFFNHWSVGINTLTGIGEIRTPDHTHPKRAFYQAELRPRINTVIPGCTLKSFTENHLNLHK